jgi:2'-5' RNA ligase
VKRLFLGIGLDQDTRSGLQPALEKLHREVQHQALRWVRPEKLHLTLGFLGPTPEETLSEIFSAAEGLRKPSPFRLTFDEIGGFPDLRRPRVLFWGIRTVPELADLHEEIRRALPIDDKPFHPHLTLARVSPGSPAVGQAVVRALAEIEVAPIEQEVTHFSLFESMPSGEYVVLREFPLV